MAFWEPRGGSEYDAVVSTLGSCALHVLGAKLGLDTMATFVHDYAVEHALGWSTTDAFKVEAQAVADGLQHPIKLRKSWKKWRIDDVP